MIDRDIGPYGTWEKAYLDLGLEPRPLPYPGIDKKTGKPLGKACKETGWQLPNTELPPGTLERWREKRASYNIGLRCGTQLKDGTCFGAVDVDYDEYVMLTKAVFGNPPCMRRGKKGVVIPVRYAPYLKSEKIRVKGNHEKFGQVVELLFKGGQFVIPPSIHPDTGQPYEWIGTPLHEIDINKLPYIGE